MNSNHEASLYGAIRILENVANDTDVTLCDVNQTISDLYAIINENPSSSSANAGEADTMIYKFNDYFPKVGNNFPKGAA